MASCRAARKTASSASQDSITTPSACPTATRWFWPERIFPDGAQGSKDPIDILGDIVVDLDEDFQVAWVWNSFDHMDLKRASNGDEKCKFGPGGGGCTPVFLADQANGWLHSNSLHYVHGSGDVLIS